MFNYFRQLFGKQDQPEGIATAPLSDQAIRTIIEQQPQRIEPAQLAAGCGQSVGKQRELNEDSLLSVTSLLSGNSGTLPFGLYVVADGMGGHQFGEVASNAAVRIVAGHILRKFHPYLFNLPAQPPEESLQEIMSESVNEAQKTIQREAPGSGTTLTAALVLGQQVTIAHIGDSRAYTVNPDGRIELITRDHSLVRRLEELGQLTSSEAASHPQRNVLYRALGQGDVLEPDIFTVTFPQPGYLLLCSDGLWGVVNEQNLYRSITETSSLQRACQNMVAAANAAGGPDNISVILVQLLG
ncbi:MAG: serine/threonine-protein phosphatase [Anaerolineales bacterium]|nr:serine/threonine-protein phosphatase [Anaerolineales bacterium]